MRDSFRLQWQPKGTYPTIRVYLRKWFLHPVKRRIARLWLALLRRFFDLRVVALTGSAGKTTTKEMILSVLSQKYKTIATEENIDPVFNIPTTILKARPATEILVLEMGIEFLGEMDFYLWLAKPDTSVLTNLYFTHTEFLGGLKQIIEEKTQLIEAVSKDGVAILNADDPLVLQQKKKTGGRLVFYGTGKKAEIRGKNVQITQALNTQFLLQLNEQSIRVNLPTLGGQNVSNALAAAAVGVVYKVPLHSIKVGLESFSTSPHRMRPIKHRSGAWIIDDTYNSNPLAAKRALDTLARIPAKRRIAVLGTMKELGEYKDKGHREVGEYAGKAGIDEIIAFGETGRVLLAAAQKLGMTVHYAKNKKEIAGMLKGRLKEGTVVLIKGSRSLAMEDIVSSLI